MVIFSFFTLFIVTGADAFLKQDPENLNRILTSPNDIIGKFRIVYDDELIGEYDLLAAKNIDKVNIFTRLIKSLNYLIWGDV